MRVKQIQRIVDYDWSEEEDVIRWCRVGKKIVPSKPPNMPPEMTDDEWVQYYLQHRADLVPRRAPGSTDTAMEHILKCVYLRGPDFLHTHRKWAKRLDMTHELKMHIKDVKERQARERAAEHFRLTGIRRPHAGLSRARGQAQDEAPKKRRGRPPGSGKRPVPVQRPQAQHQQARPSQAQPDKPKRGRGRPKGSKTRKPQHGAVLTSSTWAYSRDLEIRLREVRQRRREARRNAY